MRWAATGPAGSPALSTSVSSSQGISSTDSAHSGHPHPPGRPHATWNLHPQNNHGSPAPAVRISRSLSPLFSPTWFLPLPCPSVYCSQAQRGLRKRKSEAFKTVSNPPVGSCFCRHPPFLPVLLPSASPPMPSPPFFLFLPPWHLCPQHQTHCGHRPCHERPHQGPPRWGGLLASAE